MAPLNSAASICFVTNFPGHLARWNPANSNFVDFWARPCVSTGWAYPGPGVRPTGAKRLEHPAVTVRASGRRWATPGPGVLPPGNRLGRWPHLNNRRPAVDKGAPASWVSSGGVENPAVTVRASERRWATPGPASCQRGQRDACPYWCWTRSWGETARAIEFRVAVLLWT